MSRIAGGITIVSHSLNDNLGSNIGFQVSGSAIAGHVTCSDGSIVQLNGTDLFVKDRVDCFVTAVSSSNATTHILVYHPVRSTV